MTGAAAATTASAAAATSGFAAASGPLVGVAQSLGRMGQLCALISDDIFTAFGGIRTLLFHTEFIAKS